MRSASSTDDGRVKSFAILFYEYLGCFLFRKISLIERLVGHATVHSLIRLGDLGRGRGNRSLACRSLSVYSVNVTRSFCWRS